VEARGCRWHRCHRDISVISKLPPPQPDLSLKISKEDDTDADVLPTSALSSSAWPTAARGRHALDVMPEVFPISGRKPVD
jgi:hypothetical protein